MREDAAVPAADPEIVELDTPRGPARVHVHAVATPRAWLLLGHGAGGGVHAPDLQTSARAALDRGIGVGLVEQPYRVAGRRSPPRPPALDEAWLAIVAGLRSGPIGDALLILGGRSSGARVACRTATAAGAVGVLCLAFPLEPPRRSSPAPSRLPELEQPTVPVLVVQGERDPYGMPPAARGRTVVPVRGDHGLKPEQGRIGEVVGGWLDDVLA
jgi:predicted alpha/beta-hydrolase family hydrolase